MFDRVPPLIREDRSEAAEVLVDTPVRHGITHDQALALVVESVVVDPLEQVAEHPIRYPGAGGGQPVFDWPASSDAETLYARAILCREVG